MTLMSLVACAQAQSDEHPRVSGSSTQFVKSFDSAVDQLVSRGFDAGLESGSLAAITSEHDRDLLASIVHEKAIEVGLGDPGLLYDVVLQPGHYGRATGASGTAGKLVSERALVAYIVGRAASHLRDRGLKTLVVSADHYSSGLRAKAFLAVHADGSEAKCRTGPSLAYEANSSPYAMHAIGWALAQATGYVYKDFMRDNFTANEANYYMFGKVKTDTMKGLLEVGELTCAEVEERLVLNSDAIADNLARALAFVVGR
jgi:N-acetylmuramoyl-L-alanine amidase